MFSRCSIYGDKANEILEGLRRTPMVAVPLVLRRLYAKDDEWREAQRHFQTPWREQQDKFSLKALDVLGACVQYTCVYEYTVQYTRVNSIRVYCTYTSTV